MAVRREKWGENYMYEIAVVDICGGQDRDTFSDFLYGLKNAKKKTDLAASFLKVILSGISSFFLCFCWCDERDDIFV